MGTTDLDLERVGTWTWDLTSGHVSWDARLEAIYGFAPGSFDGSYVTYRAAIHPDDRERVGAAVQRALNTRSGHHVEHRIVRPDGSIRWIEGWGSVRLDAQGRTVGMSGVARDITAQRGEGGADVAQVFLAEEAQRLGRLQALTAALSRAASREEVAAALVERAVEATGAAAASVSIVTPDREALNILASVGYDSLSHDGWDRWPIDVDHPLGEAARTGEPRWIAERAALLADHPAMASTEGVDRFGAFAALPLRSAGSTIGVIGLSFDRDREFPPDEREHLLTMTDQVAVAIERARLYEEAERATRAAREANERLRFLGDATQLLAASLDYDETVSTLARLCVPRFADWAGVDLLESDGQVRQLVVVHEDPARLEYAREIRTRYPLDLDDPSGVAKVLRTGRSEFYPEITEELLSATPDDQREVARTIELSSVIIVPLEVRGTVLGAMSLLYGGSGRHHDEQDLRMAESLGRRAAIAIDNARVYHDRDHMARTLQRSLLPPTLPSIEGLDVAARYEPFGDGHEVGGDFYDVFAAPDDEWLLLIGDVCGKGAEAAAVMGMARFTVRALAVQEAHPATLLAGLNDAMLQQPTADRFCTAACARVVRCGNESVAVTISVAGHPAPLIQRADGHIEEVEADGSLLGIFPGVWPAEAEITLEAGDALILYTDGALGRREIDARAIVPPTVGPPDPAQRVADAIVAAAIEREGGKLRDDIAVLVLRAGDAGSA